MTEKTQAQQNLAEIEAEIAKLPAENQQAIHASAALLIASMYAQPLLCAAMSLAAARFIAEQEALEAAAEPEPEMPEGVQYG